MENEGKIATNFKTACQNAGFAQFFTFTPSNGVLKVGEQKLIQVQFAPEQLGSFKEDFVFELQVFFPYEGKCRSPITDNYRQRCWTQF